jgi:hypothetical protein
MAGGRDPDVDADVDLWRKEENQDGQVDLT